MVLVSIIIPVYNVSDYIEKCVLSVMSQTFQDIECLIVNDCTPDDSIIKCQKLIEEYQGPIKFQIINHEKNLGPGPSAARNTGTERAIGEYIYYLDGDDEISSHCIEVLWNEMKDDKTLEMVQGNYLECSEKGDKVFFNRIQNVSLKGNEMIRRYTHAELGINAAPWNKLIRKSYLLDNKIFFKEGLLFEDQLWMFNMKKYLTNVRLIPEVTYLYNIRKNSIMTSTQKINRGNNFSIIFTEILSNLTPQNEKLDLKDYVGIFCSNYLIHVNTNSNFENLHALYGKMSKNYGCWEVYIMLCIVKLMYKLGLGINSMDRLFAYRYDIIKKYSRIRNLF